MLALFNHTRETIVFADASSYGLGAVLLQRQQDGELKPISYISRSLTPTEQRYAQIEKEALAFTWACERFADFLLGMEFHIHTDHKPLVPLFGSKNLDELPIRVQRFRLRYRFTISHVPGASLKVADALSRAPCSEAQPADVVFERETAAYVDAVVQSLPATDKQIERIKHHQEEDEECQEAIRYTQSGWPSRQELYIWGHEALPQCSHRSFGEGWNPDERQQNCDSSSSQTRDARPSTRWTPRHIQVPRTGETVHLVARPLQAA